MKMKKHLWGTYGTWVLFTEAVGGLAGWLTRDGTQLYSQVLFPRQASCFPSYG